jgi:shikimate dehydrogenase
MKYRVTSIGVQNTGLVAVARTRLGVLGWPVAHSRSPAIQNAALAACGLGGWRYQLLPVPPELFEETVRALPGAGFRGANVTVPHKEHALRLADRASDGSAAIGAANTLLFEGDSTISADNTDAPAIVRSLPFPAAGLSALVLGAGGSARAAVWALLDAGAREVRVWNRTPERAERLCAELGGIPVRTADPADLLVHCTASGLDASRPMFTDLPLRADQVCRYRCVVDLVYTDSDTPLVQAARAQHVPAVDGLTVLVGQGALAFELFTGVPGPVDVMFAAVHRR